MSELWLARDQNGAMRVFMGEPEPRDGRFCGLDAGCVIDPRDYSELRPGECRRLVLEKKACEAVAQAEHQGQGSC